MADSTTATERDFDPSGITRPDKALIKYYLLVAAMSGPFFPIVILPFFFKYETLQYKFDESGISMSWGILFRREIHLTYRRIQDIHLTRGLLQRWLGLATVSIQTASGSSGPEMSIEGILEAGLLRDYLYRQMRGAKGIDDPGHVATTASAEGMVVGESVGSGGSGPSGEAIELLQEIRDLLRKRNELCDSGGGRS
ncbi:MAG: PH domain-containing protein [Pirellulales bacterium]|nr:PH domain-containing protein [Pirellulales bacterium]